MIYSAPKSSEILKLDQYLQENLVKFQALSKVSGCSAKTSVPYFVLTTSLKSVIQIEYAPETRVAQVLVTTPGMRVRKKAQPQMLQRLMKLNLRHAVGAWVMYSSVVNIAYKHCLKFPKETFEPAYIGEQILSCLSAYHYDIETLQELLETESDAELETSCSLLDFRASV